MKKPASFSKTPKRLFTTPEIPVIIGVWIAVFLIIGTRYPYHYDSINYALGIIDKFDITIDQPQAPGYFFHVMLGRLVHLAVGNPFVVQQFQNLLYLFLMLPCWYMVQTRRPYDILFLGTFPLTLFFPAIPIVHAVSLTIGTWMACSLYRMETRQWSPLVPGIIYAVGIGFRQDTLIMLGPPFLYLLIRGGYPLRTWIQLVLTGAAVSLTWYIPTRILSHGVDPFNATNAMNVQFYYGSSVILGAPLAENIRCALRFLLYGPGVVGPGGLVLLCFFLKNTRPREWLPPFLALAPIILYGTVFLLSFSYYYASALGFFAMWALLKNGFPRNRKYILLACALLNLLFFWFIPRPHYEPWRGSFATRSLPENIIKQAGYIGANGRKQALYTRDILTFADTTIGKAGTFYVEPGILWDRIWEFLAQYRWHNTRVHRADKAGVILGFRDDRRGNCLGYSGKFALYGKSKE